MPKTASASPACVSRFAPSPTGDLHFGSMLAAVGSYLQARRSGGIWLLRIEDLDPPREVPGAAERQIMSLARFGMQPDRPIERQSQLTHRYLAALDRLRRQGDAFPCSCTRAILPADGIYPGTCRQGPKAGQLARSIRFRVSNATIRFQDGIQGLQCQTPARQCGDFVIRRADGWIAYQLAVVVDDGAAGVTHVVRGADLLDSTGRQILLQQALGLAQPDYLHLPLIVDQHGRKLSKSEGADPVDRLPPADALRLLLRALGHAPPRHLRSLAALWDWAFRHWCPGRIPIGPVSMEVQGARGDDYTPPSNTAVPN